MHELIDSVQSISQRDANTVADVSIYDPIPR